MHHRPAQDFDFDLEVVGDDDLSDAAIAALAGLLLAEFDEEHGPESRPGEDAT